MLKSRLEHQELGYSWKYVHSWLLTVNEAAIYPVERCLKLLPGKNRDATGIRLAHSEEMAKEFQGIMQLHINSDPFVHPKFLGTLLPALLSLQDFRKALIGGPLGTVATLVTRGR